MFSLWLLLVVVPRMTLLVIFLNYLLQESFKLKTSSLPFPYGLLKFIMEIAVVNNKGEVNKRCRESGYAKKLYNHYITKEDTEQGLELSMKVSKGLGLH